MPIYQIIISIEENIGALARILKIFEKYEVTLNHLESRPGSQINKKSYDFLVEFGVSAYESDKKNDLNVATNLIHQNDRVNCGESKDSDGSHLGALLEEIKSKCLTFKVVTDTNNNTNEYFHNFHINSVPSSLENVHGDTLKNHQNDMDDDDDDEILRDVPWFPKKLSDLNKLLNRVLSYGVDLDADHPGFKDDSYKKRRMEIAEIAINYKLGQPIPRVKYTEEEIETWGNIFRQLTKLYPTHACEEYNENFVRLIEKCGFREDNIPQLEDVSNFLQESSGYRLRPVAGLLSNRDYLAGLAFRVFNCTQYVRHPSAPNYTPEPDVCHELFGHVALFANPDFAQFSQEIGLASLGISEEYIDHLAACYFFTVEFGLCIQNGTLKVYGAGILSSVSEIQYALTDKPVIKPFDPITTALQPCMLSQIQPVYFYTESFVEAKQKLLAYVATLPRKFSTRYDPYTQKIQIIKGKKSFARILKDTKWDLDILLNALPKITK